MPTISVFRPSDTRELQADLIVDSGGDLTVARGLEDVRQRAIERLRWWRGEWFLDEPGGIPYLTEILTRPATAGLAQSLITAELLDVEGVTGVRDVRVNIVSGERRLRLSATIDTIYGAAEAEG